jgi:hypothetical protein
MVDKAPDASRRRGATAPRRTRKEDDARQPRDMTSADVANGENADATAETAASEEREPPPDG